VSQIKPSSLNSPPSRLAPQGSGPADRGIAEFEALYRANVAVVTAYFARRSAEPQTVADLTAGTFVQAITSFATFDPRKGTPRAWVLSVAPGTLRMRLLRAGPGCAKRLARIWRTVPIPRVSQR
jgi:DNA-directed RNA polymerase specialized sigma24 family protein